MATIATAIFSPGPWAQLVGFRDILCPDGKRRACRVGIPDSYSSAPGRISYKGKTVSGFATSTGDEGDMKFVPTGKHRDIFGRWIDARLLPESAPALPQNASWYWASGLECWCNTADYRCMDATGTVYDDYRGINAARHAVAV